MPSERVAQCFRDIISAIDLIQSWVANAGGPEPAMAHNTLVRSAVERQILVISEAAIRLEKLGPGVAERAAGEIDWRGIRGIGNFIRHRYDDLYSKVVSDVIHNRLGQLR